MTETSGIFDDPGMLEAEERLRSALEKLLEGMSQGPTIASVHSTGWTEDGATFTVYCDLPDGTLALWSFEAGRPVAYSVHDLGREPSAPLPNVVRLIATCAPGKRVTVVAGGKTYELPLPRNLRTMCEELQQLELDIAARKQETKTLEQRALALHCAVDDEIRQLIEPLEPRDAGGTQ